MNHQVSIETSARHVHLTAEDFATLFGQGVQPTIKKELSEPGQFAYNEKVTVVGPKKSLAGVSILGPYRSKTQVELSGTDARSIGIDAPVRLSGDLEGSAPCKLLGPAGELEIAEGVVVAKRHLHTNPQDAAELGLSENETILLKIATPDRTLIFDDVLVRITPGFIRTVHIDTDESNAAGCTPKTMGEILRKEPAHSNQK